jgi:hypothetical protein
VSELKESILEYVHAIITPDGAWHEQGRMGWWGMIHDEKPENVWRNEAATILLTHRDALAVGCDLDIEGAACQRSQCATWSAKTATSSTSSPW